MVRRHNGRMVRHIETEGFRLLLQPVTTGVRLRGFRKSFVGSLPVIDVRTQSFLLTSRSLINTEDTRFVRRPGISVSSFVSFRVREYPLSVRPYVNPQSIPFIVVLLFDFVQFLYFKGPLSKTITLSFFRKILYHKLIS